MGLSFSLSRRPETMREYRKNATIRAAFVSEPFEIETQEGVMLIHPTTVDGWDDGYYVAYPSDGSKPYAIAPEFLRKNYVEA